MRKNSIFIGMAVLFVAVVCSAASTSAHMGTWKLNEAKSKFTPGSGKNTTVVYAADGDNIKVTVDGVDGDGKATHSDWTGKFDGKDYAVTGDPTSDMRSYKVVDDHTLSLSATKGGKVTLSGTVVVSADGKSRTVTTSGTNAKGEKISTTAVYDKQ